MSEILTVSFLTSVLTAAIRAGTPLLFALLGEIIAERGDHSGKGRRSESWNRGYDGWGSTCGLYRSLCLQ